MMAAAAARKFDEVPASRRGAKGKDSADAWTTATEPAPAEVAEPIKKLSLEIPESVHRATKSGAAMRGHTMISEVIEACSARNGLRPWPTDVVDQVLAQLVNQADAYQWPAAVVAQVKAQITAEEAAGATEQPEAAQAAPVKRARTPRKRAQA